MADAPGGLRSRIATRRARLDGAGRERGIDLARGLAVIGMFAAHLLDTSPFDGDDPTTWTDVVNGRSSILFATLAGVSLALVSGGSTPVAGTRMDVVRGRVVVRAVSIWAIGILLIALETPVYVILPAYALLFLAALPVLSLRASTLFAIAGAVAVAGPFLVWLIDTWAVWETPAGAALEQATGWHYPFVLWFAFVAAGMGIGRLASSRPSTAGALVCFGAALALLGYGIIGRWAPVAPAETVWSFVLSSEAHSSGVAEAVGSGGFAIAVIGACVLLCATPARWLVWPLRAVGSMPLTAYAAQLVAWALLQPEPTVLQLGSDLVAFRALDPFWPLTIATIAACTLWALLVGRGPLEAAIGWAAKALVPAR
ncbi:heparan-alpha-glucosaminide N-acetyltransferase domain-containing protein [Microbacterium betulae]|uniref:Heparan-alpha-glucosaminide N-acetyltransferase domain-containing protein n=1 Tax=Microbacterium betulae TaxID=2981139 RepID=A0AA97FFB7_9MICO|nr:heparan-alpha-glucosaminide N-acetyltransferase domain-containing protein [Microbacterium sp. AB]WOF21985.1 heparan-alpha-glucosaminide N-acetyltransferase domain-containing protein [Microbacterium sp. AB]